MIHPKTNAQRGHEPVYRHVLRQALHAAWYDRRYWILSFFASFLFTAGIYDTVLRSLWRMGSFDLKATPLGLFSGLWPSFDSVTSFFGVLQIVALGAILVLALLIGSCIGQAALTYALGAKKFQAETPLRDALTAGSRLTWPVAALNILANLGYYGLAAIFFMVAMALRGMPWFFFLAVVLVALLLMAGAFAVGIVQVFALNAVVLQGATLTDALARAHTLLKRHWLVALETSAILMAIALIVEFSFVVLAALASLLFQFATLSALALRSPMLFLTAAFVWLVAVGGMRFVASAFKTQLQFASWTFLYRRLGEGGVLPKLHRIFRVAFGQLKAPKI